MNPGPLGPVFAGSLFAHGFSWRKRAILADFTARRDIRHVARGEEVAGAGAELLLWGSAPVPAGVPEDAIVVRVEDGFLRSVGLGADLARPVSWVFDDAGIYYDATRPSALERLLQAGELTGDELTRAAALRTRIVEAGITKYNLAAQPWKPASGGRPVVLVPGQVETDASIAHGTVDIRTNLGLLQAVRSACPQAWVVYKPHPDVVAGLRGQGAGENEAARHCDEIVEAGSMHQMLEEVDEVHVLTSLTGFEGLLRGKAVTCWGQPFYAGWGLTRDRHPHPRRTRRLTLDELVAGALIRYPAYVGRSTGERCTPEQVLDELAAWRAQAPKRDPWWRRALRPLLARP